MNDFVSQKKKPSTKEYLEASLDDVIARLNNNPSGLESEFPFIQSLITVRSAKVSEKLTKRLNLLTESDHTINDGILASVN